MNLMLGDCLEQLKNLPDNSVDSVVTDAPYGISFMSRSWDYDVPAQNIWEECFRVLKPGGHLLSFFGTRTYHRGVVRIEDAGFEIRDQIMWIYGSGFPKSTDVSKRIDKEAGAEREVVGMGVQRAIGGKNGSSANHGNGGIQYNPVTITAPSTPEAIQWQGWGTALKPANEPIVVARKPLEKGFTVAQNVLKWGTGALNIDGSRIETTDNLNGGGYSKNFDGSSFLKYGGKLEYQQPAGRWPANIIFDEFQEQVLVLKDSIDSGIRQAIEVFYASYGPLQNLQNEDDNVSESKGSKEVLLKGVLLQGSKEKTGANDGKNPLREVDQKDASESFQKGQRQSEMEGRLVFEGVSTHKYSGTAGSSVEYFDTDVSEGSGLASRTPGKDGSEVGASSIEIGSSASQERNQGRQSNSKSRTKRHKSTQEGTLASIERSEKTTCLVRESDVPQVWLQYFESSGFTVRAGSAKALDEQSGVLKSGELKGYNIPGASSNGHLKGKESRLIEKSTASSGGASRFFYVAKASKAERNAGLEGMPKRGGPAQMQDGSIGKIRSDGTVIKEAIKHENFHPTVKPLKLGTYLQNLVTPPGGVTLDPFMGSGSFGVSAKAAGFQFIGIERDPQYFEIAKNRIESAGPVIEEKDESQLEFPA